MALSLLQRHFSEILFSTDPSNHPVMPSQCPAVNVTSSARWFMEEAPDGFGEWRQFTDFPGMVPPWPVVWMEYSLPKQRKLDGEMQQLGWLVGKPVGGVVITKKLALDARETWQIDPIVRQMQYWAASAGRPESFATMPGVMEKRRAKLDALMVRAITPKWGTFWHFIMERADGTMLTIGEIGLYLDEQGSPIDDATLWALGQDVGGDRGYSDGTWAAMLWTIASPFFFSTSLLNCKNVQLVDIPVPDKVRKARAKRGIPDIRFKTLVVEPLREVIRREQAGDKRSSGIKMALHICRGHFKDYRDKGLFGKYKGVFWWDMHARGSAELGTIEKTYEVKR